MGLGWPRCGMWDLGAGGRRASEDGAGHAMQRMGGGGGRVMHWPTLGCALFGARRARAVWDAGRGILRWGACVPDGRCDVLRWVSTDAQACAARICSDAHAAWHERVRSAEPSD